jgi:hypothetical protein
MSFFILRAVSWVLMGTVGFSGPSSLSFAPLASLLSQSHAAAGSVIQDSGLIAKLPKHCKKLKTPKPKKATKKSNDMCWCTPGGPVACSQIDKKKTKKKKTKKSEVLPMFASPFTESEIL